MASDLKILMEVVKLITRRNNDKQKFIIQSVVDTKKTYDAILVQIMKLNKIMAKQVV